MADSETALLERFSARADGEAFAELVRRYIRLVYSVSWRVLKDEGDAADVTQETFFELTRQAGHISGSLGSWLHRVATRKSIDLVRRSVHRRRRERVYAETQPQEVRTWRDLSGYVDEAMDRLNEPAKSLLLDHFMAGKTTVEIARERGVSQATVSRRVNEGLEQLRGTLRRQGLLVAAASLGAMLMDNASQAVPATVAAELSKTMMVGTTGGGTAAVAVNAWAVKAVLATAAVVAVGSVVGYIHYSRRPGPPSQSSVPSQIVGQPAQKGSRRSDSASRVTTAGKQPAKTESGPSAASSAAEPKQPDEPVLEFFEPLPRREGTGGISTEDPFSGVPTADLTTPEAVVYSLLALIDEGATDQLDECLAEGHEVATDGPYPRYLGRPVRLVEVTEHGETARVLWEATAHTRFSHKGRDCFPGESVPLSSRVVRIDGLWRLLKLDE